MKRTLLPLFMTVALGAGLPMIAHAQSINDRQESLDARIDAGVRDRSLTTAEAAQLRSEFQALVRLENQYRANGLTQAERNDLDDRFDGLSDRIQYNRNDDEYAGQSINERQASLDARIDAGVRDRSLTTAEAAQLRTDFQALVRLENQYRANGLTQAERADLNSRFDGLSDRIEYNRNDDDYAGQSINERQASLDARIDAGVRDRSLTTAEAAQLRTDFQALVRLENQYRANGFTQAERADLNSRFDGLSDRIQRDRNDDEYAGQSINERQADLDARIDAGVRDRSLTAAEAAQLRAEFKALVRLEDQYRANGLTSAERADLNSRFDGLSDRIRSDRNDDEYAGQSMNQRQASVNARIDAGVRNGSLTSTEAAQLRAEFQSIVRLEAQYRASGGGLTLVERTALDGRFSQLMSRIQVERNDNDNRWTNLNQRQAQFNERLDRAVGDGRVTARQAYDLRAEFDAIARLEANYRRSAPGMTQAERNDLNARFDRLETNFRASINAGRYGDGTRQYDNLFDFLFGIGR